MSLSFVKSAVLSSTDGISHNEETTIDNKETQSLRANSAGAGGHKPLFEQLRANKEAEQERDEEFQRSLRGTRPLDEEDCAHLNAIERRREEYDCAVKSGIEREVALFHAAREDRGLAQTVMEGGGDNDDEEIAKGDEDVGKPTTTDQNSAKVETKKIVPKFTIKKKRKRVSQDSASKGNGKSNNNDASQPKKSTIDAEEGDAKKGKANDADGKKESSKASNSDSDSDNEGGGLLGLGCYGSDSD